MHWQMFGILSNAQTRLSIAVHAQVLRTADERKEFDHLPSLRDYMGFVRRQIRPLRQTMGSACTVQDYLIDCLDLLNEEFETYVQSRVKVKTEEV